MAKIALPPGSQIATPNVITQKSPDVAGTQALSQLGQQFGRIGKQLAQIEENKRVAEQKLQLERDKLKNSRDEATQKLRDNALTNSIMEFMTANPGEPEEWQRFYDNQWDERNKEFEADKATWNPEFAEKYTLQYALNRQKGDSIFNRAKINAEIENNNQQWKLLAEQSWNVGDENSYFEAISNLRMSEAKRNRLDFEIRSSGEYQKALMLLNELQTPEELQLFSENIETVDNPFLTQGQKGQLEYVSNRRAASTIKKYASTFNREVRKLKKGEFLTDREIDDLVLQNEWSVEQADLYRQSMSVSAQTFELESEYNTDKTRFAYRTINDNIINAWVNPDDNVEITQEEIDEIQKNIEESGLGEWAKGDLYGMLFEAQAASLIEKDNPWFKTAIGEEISEAERAFRVDYLTRLQTIMAGRPRLDGLYDIFKDNDQKISIFMALQGDKLNQELLGEFMNQMLSPYINLITNEQIRRQQGLLIRQGIQQGEQVGDFIIEAIEE